MNKLIAITTETMFGELGGQLHPTVFCKLLVANQRYAAPEAEGGSGELRQSRHIRALRFDASPASLRAAAHDLIAAADAADDLTRALVTITSARVSKITTDT